MFLSSSECSVHSLSCVLLSATSWMQHARLPFPSPIPRAHSNSCPSSWWCYPTISFSVIPFSSCLQSFPASGSFPVNQSFASGGQSIGAFSFSISPSNEESGLIFFRTESPSDSTVFSNTTVQKHQFFSTQLSLRPNSHIHTWLLDKP